MVLVKICGIKRIEDALAAAAAGVDELGFHVALDHGRSPLSPEEAKAIIAQLPSSVIAVVVTSVTEPAKLIEIAKKTDARILQLYGDVTPAAIREVKRGLPNIVIWRALHVSDGNVTERAREFEGIADALVLDTPSETGALGGSGKTHDWSLSEKVGTSVSIPVVLAGGLNTENIAEAISAVRPAVVDVHSGVSNPDGSKDMAKVKLFVQRAKAGSQ